MKILITETETLASNEDISLDAFSKYGEVTLYGNIPHDELVEVIKDYDIVLINKAVIDREVLEKAEKLKYIGTFATGYNNIDIPLATQMNITVSNVPGYSTDAVAQQALTYILMHYSKVREYNDFVKEGGWQKCKTFSHLAFPSDEVKGKTLGIIGFGAIGGKLAKVALALDMRVLAYSRTKKEVDGVEFVSFDELLENSDIVSLHCPLNEQTVDLMNKDAFSKMKNGAFFINTSRGPLVDEDALYEALQTGKLSGAALDVLRIEPMSKDCKLLNAPNIIITPHSAWSPLATRKRLMKIVCQNIEAFLDGKPQNKVN